jgi:membrane protein implicated in regulation of membrane protease activity
LLGAMIGGTALLAGVGDRADAGEWLGIVLVVGVSVAVVLLVRAVIRRGRRP